MKIFIYILVSLAIVVGIIACVIEVKEVEREHRENAIISIFAGTFSFLFIIVLVGAITQEINGVEPRAIDVYRGKTETLIKGTMIEDSFIPEDTLVVFKDEYNGK